MREQPLFPHAEWFDISVTIEHGKNVTMLQNSGPVIDRRRPRCYVVLLRDSNFIQLRTPSERGVASESR